jgi:erythromycin esterase
VAARVEPDATGAGAAWQAYRCFEPYSEDPQAYAWATRFVPEDCEDEVVTLLAAAQKKAESGDELGLRQNAEVVAGAERYYRAMVAGGAQSWNVRDQHMAGTLDRLLAAYGAEAKGVVWAHNTHVGDARATDMAEAGEVNIGQLARDRYGRDQVVLVGFGTHRGRVIAAEAWGAPMATLPVPAARPGSLEAVMHEGAPAQALLIVPPSGEAGVLVDWLGHRAVGVVYHPQRDHWANYVPTRLGTGTTRSAGSTRPGRYARCKCGGWTPARRRPTPRACETAAGRPPVRS